MLARRMLKMLNSAKLLLKQSPAKQKSLCSHPSAAQFSVDRPAGQSDFRFTQATEPGLYRWLKVGGTQPLAVTQLSMPATESDLTYRDAKSVFPGTNVIITSNLTDLRSQVIQPHPTPATLVHANRHGATAAMRRSLPRQLHPHLESVESIAAFALAFAELAIASLLNRHGLSPNNTILLIYRTFCIAHLQLTHTIARMSVCLILLTMFVLLVRMPVRRRVSFLLLMGKLAMRRFCLLQKVYRAKSFELMEANHKDITAAEGAGLAPQLVARLKLDEKKIEAMAAGVESIARQTDPVGQTLEGYVRPDGLRIEKRRVPIGVILFFYESRPNVTSDAAALCLKSGNAVILRGGKEAFYSNQCITRIISQSLKVAGLPEHAVQIVDSTDRAPGAPIAQT